MNPLRLMTFLLMSVTLTAPVFAQNTVINGTIKNSVTGEVVPAASVTIKGSSSGTFTDSKGNFKLLTNQRPPFTLLISSIGFETQEVSVSSASSNITISFVPASSLGSEVVVSASRVPERILESPVSIERVNAAAIRNAPAADYYDIAKTLKGVDVTNSSLTFSSITTRGFNGSGNPRFNQFVDGMDNQAPGLNFSVGSVVGPTELDVDNVELLPGASSALYGSGGMNGTLLITSKDPFKYQGVSAEVKVGGMHVGSKDVVGSSPYYNLALRWAQKINDKFAFKIGVGYIRANDWAAHDSTNYTGSGNQGKTTSGTRTSDPNYNGVNLYGDETSLDINNPATPFLLGAAQQYILANPGSAVAVGGVIASDGSNPFGVSRTGYKETDIVDPITYIVKLNGGLYYKINSNTEASLMAYYGTGNSVYTGSDRYSLKNLQIGQYKLEIKNDKWFIRAYTTQENSGDAFNATVTSQLFNEAWKRSYDPTSPQTVAGSWYPQYAYAYLSARVQGADVTTANNAARSFADAGRPVPGSPTFKTIFDQVVSKPIPAGGKFLDRTDLYQTEGQYNFTDQIKFADVTVGASYRLYRLNSQGTLFADTTGAISTSEYGAYLQVSKRLLNDKLKLTASGRYDKNENFKGKFTPRFSAVVTVAPDQYVRASYQNAYRFPSNQNQWINLRVGDGILIGGLPELRKFYHFDTNPPVNPSTGQLQNFGEYKPESVNAYEVGYKGLFNKRVLVDFYGYYSRYQNFIGRINVAQSNSGNPADIDPSDASTYTGYSVSVNSPNKVSTYGFGLSIDYILPNNFNIGFNASNDNIDNPDATFVTYFSTPKYRTNISVSNTGFGPSKLFGFNVQYRWQDVFYTESDFKQGQTPAFSTIDAQINYKLTKVRSMIKLGATNLLNHYYISAYGNPSIGGLYYVGFAYNIF